MQKQKRERPVREKAKETQALPDEALQTER